MSIAVRFDNTLIVSNEYDYNVTFIRAPKQDYCFDVVNPFIVEGEVPNEGMECAVLTEDKKVYKCLMFNKVYTESKLRLIQIEEIEFKQQDWKTIK